VAFVVTGAVYAPFRLRGAEPAAARAGVRVEAPTLTPEVTS
jgi:hypothetical protein